MQNIKPEDLGDMGESFFKILCKNVGFILNSSKSDDKGGWDFEIEHRINKHINYSTQSYPVYRVQVKSTQGKSQTRLTYSNLLKLIQYSGPSFIALIKYSNDVNPDSAFIFHIDENFSKSLLKEIREKEVKSKNFTLNKNEKVIKFNEKNKIITLDGQGLKAAIEKHVGSDHLKYVENKLKYLSDFERKGQLKQFVWFFKSEEDIAAMANCFLGYQEEFNIDFSEYNAPFGISDQVPVSTYTGHKTTIKPTEDELTETVICLRTSEFGKQYEFTGTTYIIPEQLRQFSKIIRTECPLFDFLFDYNERSIDIRLKNIFSEEIEVPFRELYNFFCFINESISSKETYIKLIDKNSNKSAEVRLGVPKFKLDSSFQIFFEVISSIHSRLWALNVDHYLISPKYLWDNIGRFNLFRIMDKEYTPDFVMEFCSNKDEKPDVNTVIFCSTVEFKQSNLIIFVAFYGTLEKINENVFSGAFNKSELLGEYLVNGKDDIRDLINAKLEYHKNILEGNGFIVLD